MPGAVVARSGHEHDFSRIHAAGEQVVEGPCPLTQRTLIDPIEAAELAVENRLCRVAEVLRTVGIGADEADLLQRHPPDIEATFIIPQTDVGDDPAGPDDGRGNLARWRDPDRVDHQMRQGAAGVRKACLKFELR